ncbi:MAG: helix-turn-helix transcriptional regulator [Fidelibacterota bacterium]|nr:MAG: helix-turn-helix transcriptional regulator [Candidatus Neomarinimicrobiota bacterium]
MSIEAERYPLLATKLFVPPLRADLVPRRRLMALLDEGTDRSLTLISAPAGYGKTTLLNEWVHRDHKPVAWLSLDPDDNDPARFVAYIIAAIQTVEKEVGNDAAAILQSPRTPPIETVLTSLINDITGRSIEITLVLDDYHLVDTQQINHIVEFLLTHSPARLHLIISTRSDPALPLARLRARGQLTEVRASDLCFSIEETSQFIQKGAGIDLSSDELGKLVSRTEGWIAGLQLAALSMRGRNDYATFINSFTGDERHIADYLVEEVLNRQPEEVQTFLLETSILERLSGPLCDAVVGRDGSQQILRELERSNLFIVPLDSERFWFRYHHLFAELLHQRLHQIHGNLDPQLHRRASIWYESNGLTAVAINHALSAKDYDRAMELIEQVAEETFMRSELATLLGWFTEMPEDTLRSRPLLCTYQATAMLLGGRPLEEAEAHLPDTINADVSDAVAGAIALFRSMVTAYAAERLESMELANQALELLPRENLFFRSMAAGILGLNAFYSGDLEAANEALENAAHISEQAGNFMNAVLAVSHLAELAWMQGQLQKAESLYQRALQLGTDEHGRLRPIAGLALTGLGGLRWEHNDLQAAYSMTTQGIALTNRWGETGAITGHLTLARILQSQGDIKGTQAEIDSAKQIAINFDAMEMDDILVDLYQTRVWVAQGNLDAATKWISDRALDGELGSAASVKDEYKGPSTILRILEFMTLARVENARNQPDRALKVLEVALQLADQGGFHTYRIEIYLLQSLALLQQGDTHEAVETLARALELGEPGNYIRTFIDHGEGLGTLLGKILDRQQTDEDRIQVSPDYVKKLLLALKTKPVIQSDGSLVEPLSSRELDVLRLMATGLSNSNIAQNLFISLNTVKTHIKNIHSKLHVHTRTQAIAKAKEIGLL